MDDRPKVTRSKLNEIRRTIDQTVEEIEYLRSVEDWCLSRLKIKPNSRAKIKHDLGIGKGSGWYHYRECLVVGTEGTVGDVRFNRFSCDGRGNWQAAFIPDRQWSVTELYSSGTTRFWKGRASETPEGYEPPTEFTQKTYPDGEPSIFNIDVDHLEAIR